MSKLAKSFGRVFGLERKDVDVRVGSVFRHTGPGDLIEIAKVLDIEPDSMGIPHVRFELVIERNQKRIADLDTRRTLNLETFASRFSELVQA
jgi:hypothetical protein